MQSRGSSVKRLTRKPVNGRGPDNKCAECCEAEDIGRSCRKRDSRVSSAQKSAGNDRSKASRTDLEGPNDFNENP